MATATFSTLKKKYRNFAAPTMNIKVNGSEIYPKDGVSIQDMEVELTSQYQASGCSFSVHNQYVPKNTDFDRKGIFSKLQLGAKVEIKLGYIATETVFKGLVTQVSYEFDGEDSAPFIRVECMDAKFLLMKTRRLEIMGTVKLNQAVKDLLGEQPASSYLDGTSVEPVQGFPIPLHNAMLSDYDFIVRQAQYFGCEFFVLRGKAYFRKIPDKAAPTVSLGSSAGVLSATVSIRGDSLVSQVKVSGVDLTGEKAVNGSASISGKFGSGSSPKKMLGKSFQAFYDPYSTDAKSAADRAGILMKGITGEFGVISCRCIGLPEIVPGSFIKLSGLMKEATGTFYVINVRHSLNEDGYVTTFEARFNSL